MESQLSEQRCNIPVHACEPGGEIRLTTLIQHESRQSHHHTYKRLGFVVCLREPICVNLFALSFPNFFSYFFLIFPLFLVTLKSILFFFLQNMSPLRLCCICMCSYGIMFFLSHWLPVKMPSTNLSFSGSLLVGRKYKRMCLLKSPFKVQSFPKFFRLGLLFACPSRNW